MSLKQRYLHWSEFQKNLFIMVAVAIVGALVCAIFVFLDNVGVLLGWLAGCAVNLIAYVTIAKGASFVLDQTDLSGKRGYLTALFGMFRFLLYAGVLVLAGFASFRWGTLEHGYLNLVSCALALMPNWVVLSIMTYSRLKKKPAPKVEEKKEEEAE